MIKAIEYSGREYIKQKREFLRIANELGFESDDKTHVDKILLELTKTRGTKDPFILAT